MSGRVPRVGWASLGGVGLTTLAVAQPIPPVTFDFSSGPQGWSLIPGVTWQSSGGRPGGNLRFSRELATDGVILGPSSLHGDWTSLRSDGEIAMDFTVEAFALPEVAPFVQLSGPGGVLRGYLYTIQGSTPWRHHRLRLQPSEWVVRAGSFAGTLADVNQVQFSMQASLSTSAITRLDNFTIRRRACIEINSAPVPMAACLRGRAGFTVDAVGLETLTYRWVRVGVGAITDGQAVDGPYVLGSATRTLTLIGVRPRDEGEYQAIVTSSCGEVVLAPARLTVCVADVPTDNGFCDGGVTVDDLLWYLAHYAYGYPEADVDDGTQTGTLDDGVTIEDVLYYVQRYAAGC